MEILVQYNDFIKYQENYHTTYLDIKHKYRIWSKSKTSVLNNFNTINEIFDGIETEYSIINTNGNYKILFNTKSGTGYCFDLFKEL